MISQVKMVLQTIKFKNFLRHKLTTGFIDYWFSQGTHSTLLSNKKCIMYLSGKHVIMLTNKSRLKTNLKITFKHFMDAQNVVDFF